MKITLIGLMICLSFSFLKAQDSTSILRLEYQNMLEQKNYLQSRIYEFDYKESCSTKKIYKIEKLNLLQSKTSNFANQLTVSNRNKTLQDSISEMKMEVSILRGTLFEREREPINHFGGRISKFNLNVCPCSSLNHKDKEVETMFFTFFKEHNRDLLGLETNTQFRELTPYNMPSDVLFWCIPTKFYLIEKLKPIDNAQNGNATVSDLQNAFKDGTVKFINVRRIAK